MLHQMTGSRVNAEHSWKGFQYIFSFGFVEGSKYLPLFGIYGAACGHTNAW